MYLRYWLPAVVLAALVGALVFARRDRDPGAFDPTLQIEPTRR